MNKTNLKIGTKVRVKSNTCSHNIPIGSEIELAHKTGKSYQIKGRTCYITPEDIELLTLKKEDIEKQIASLKEEVKVLNEKINYTEGILVYLKENKIKEFNEVEYQAFRVLQTISENSTDVEKSKAIAKIIGRQK